MPVRKVGARWLIDIRYRDDRYRVRSPGTTKGDAQAHEVYLRGELAKHGSLDHLDAVPAKMPTFAEFAERWMREYVAVRNRPMEQQTKRSALRHHILPALGKRPIDKVDAAAMSSLQTLLRTQGLAPKTVNNYLGMVHACLRFAALHGIIATVPTITKIRVPIAAPRNISEADLAQILPQADKRPLFHAMLRFAVATGLRFSEIAGLYWDDIDLERRLLCVRRADVRGHVDVPKNGRVRFVPLNQSACAALADLPRLTRRVFLRHGRPVTYRSAHGWLTRACRRAGVRPVGWHALRHTFASELVSRGATLYAVRDLLGHSSTAMTARYAHLAPDYLRTTVSLLDAPTRERALGGHSAPKTHSSGPAPTEMLARFSAKKTQENGTDGAATHWLRGLDSNPRADDLG